MLISRKTNSERHTAPPAGFLESRGMEPIAEFAEL
jgi:hypothetical protein